MNPRSRRVGRPHGFAAELEDLNTPSIDFLMLADRVEAINGKLYAMGGAWDRMFVQDVKHPTTISFAAVILVPWNATNQQHSVTLAVEDADGHNIGFTIEVGFNAGRPPWSEQGEAQRVVIAIPAAPILFPRYGAFVVKAYIDGQPSGASAFRVVQPPVGLPMMGISGAA